MTNRKNDVRKTASTLNSKWLQNTLRSMGVAGTEMIKDLMPATTETVMSAASVASETAKSVRQGKSVNKRLENAIKNNPAVKLGQDYFRNAIEDIKTGNFYNTERDGMGLGSDDSGTDISFDDFGDIFPEDESSDVNIINEAPSDLGVQNATIKALDRNADYQVKSTKATVDTMVSIASTSLAASSKASQQLLSEVTRINSNLSALVDYHNQNMTKFIDASIGFYEQMAGDGRDNSSGGQTKISPEDIFSSSGAIDFSQYKEYIKQNISKVGDNSIGGSMVKMLLENKDMLGMMVSNPLGGVMKMAMKSAIPQITRSAMENLDKSMKDFFPVMLERLGEIGQDDNSMFGGVARTIGSIFGIKSDRKKVFDLSKIEKGPMPYNGVANHTIIEIIPKYLRESNTYLREIAETLTGRTNEQMSENFTGFDWETGTFKNLEEMQRNVFDEIESRTTQVFKESTFGEKMASQKSLLKNEEDRNNYDKALEQLYLAMEKQEGKLDFHNEDQMKNIMNDVNASDNIKNLIESYMNHMLENSDAAIGNAIATKQKATRERNIAMKDVEANAQQRGLRQFATEDSYDKYIQKKYKSDATVGDKPPTPKPTRVTTISLLQGIQNTLDRGIYVVIKRKFDKGGSSDDDNPGPDPSPNPPSPPPTVSQSKDEFKAEFINQDKEDQDTDDILNTDEDGRPIRGARSAKKINAFAGMINGIMAGNTDSAWDGFIQGIGNKLKQAGEFLSEHFFTPIKSHLFGERDDNGYIHGGIFGGVNNRMKESFFSLRKMITGKGYTDAEGNSVPDATEEEMGETVVGKVKSMLGSLKEGIQLKLFGKKDDDGELATDPETGKPIKEGIINKARDSLSKGVSSFMKGLTGWKHALFGKDADESEDEEEVGRKTWEDIKAKAKDVMPNAMTGSLTGGVLGMLVGGPVGGALIGLAGGILSKSEKFKTWLFGEKDENGERLGGVISKKVQNYMKENGKVLAGGAAIGAIQGSLGLGLLGSIAGGPVVGALLGIGTTMIAKSEFFQKFLFGDEKSGQRGLVNIVKGWFGKFGKGRNGQASGGKVAGMMGIGAGAGALTGSMLLSSGVLGLSLGAAGPIGGAIVGLGAAILATKDNFKEWLFGKTDKETGEKREGVIGKFGNMLKVNVFRPVINSVKNIGEGFKSFLYHNVLVKFNNIVEPIGDAIFGNLASIGGKAVETISGFGHYIKENYLDKLIDKAKGLLTPITKGVTAAAEGIANVTKKVIGAPFTLMEAIVGPIGQAVGKAFLGVGRAISGTVKWAIIKPINNLVLKPLTKAVGLATTIISAPFKAVGKVVTVLHTGITNVTRKLGLFFTNLGTEFKDWFFHKNPVAKGLRKVGDGIKNFGARIKDTWKILVSPLTDFVKSALTEVKETIKNSVKRFFHYLNPLTWIRGLGKGIKKLFGRDDDSKGNSDKDPSKMGMIRRAWYNAGQEKLTDATLGGTKELSYFERRRESKKQAKYGRRQVYFEDENTGMLYFETLDGKWYDVHQQGKSKPVGKIKKEELPEGLKKKTTGVDGKIQVLKSKKFRKDQNYNEKLIDKWTRHQKSDDTKENRDLAIENAKRKGVTLNFRDIDYRDQEKVDEVKRQQQTAENTEKNTEETAETLKKMYQWIIDPKKYKEDLKKKAAFLRGEEDITEEENERIDQRAKERGEGSAATVASDQYKNAKRKDRKKNDKSRSRERRAEYDHNAKKTGGTYRNFKSAIAEARAGLKEYNKLQRWKSQGWDINRPIEVDEDGNPIGYKDKKGKEKSKDETKGKDSSTEEKKNDDDATVDEDIPKHATGTQSAKKGFAVVGENGPEVMYDKGSTTGKFVGVNGPEVINMSGGETIVPNSQIHDKKSDDKSAEFSNASDESLSRATDTKKLTIGERIIKGLFDIRDLTRANMQSNDEDDKSNDETKGSSTSDDYDEGYETTNLQKLKNGLTGGIGRIGRTILNLFPGGNILSNIIGAGANIVKGAGTVVGAGKEIAQIGFGETKKYGKKLFRGFGKVKNLFRRDKKDIEKTEDSSSEEDVKQETEIIPATPKKKSSNFMDGFNKVYRSFQNKKHEDVEDEPEVPEDTKSEETDNATLALPGSDIDGNAVGYADEEKTTPLTDVADSVKGKIVAKSIKPKSITASKSPIVGLLTDIRDNVKSGFGDVLKINKPNPEPSNGGVNLPALKAPKVLSLPGFDITGKKVGYDQELKDKKEKEKEDAQLALAEVTDSTGSAHRAELATQAEEDSDDARDDAILASLQNIDEGQKKHNKSWDFLFGKKGKLIAVILPFAFKFLSSFWDHLNIGPVAAIKEAVSNIDLRLPSMKEVKAFVKDIPNQIKKIPGLLKKLPGEIQDALLNSFNMVKNAVFTLRDTVVDWCHNFVKDFNFGMENLGDGDDYKDKLWDNAKRWTRVYDENGNIDHQSGARAKVKTRTYAKMAVNANTKYALADKAKWVGDKAKWVGNKASSGFGKWKTRAGTVMSDTKSMWDNSRFKNAWNVFRNKEVDPIANPITNNQGQLLLGGADINGNVVGTAEDVAKNNKKSFGTRFKDAWGTFRNKGAQGATDDMARAATNLGDDGAKKLGTKVAKEGADEKLWTKVMNMIEGAFDGVVGKVTKEVTEETGSKVVKKAISGSTDEVLKNVSKCKKHFGKVSARISRTLGITAGLAATGVGLLAKEGTWIALGALNGLSGAKRLFQTDETDNLMMIISGAIGALAGTTVGSIVDIINELVVSVLGIDILSELAVLIYSAIQNVSGNEEATEALKKAREEFKQKYEDATIASYEKQLETQKKLGIVDKNETLEGFKKGVQEGKYSAEIKSFADYNDDQHETVMSKMGKSLKTGLTPLKETLFGSKKVTKTDKSGNVYTQNKDGTWQAKSRSGEDMGYVSGDAIPEDAVDTVKKTEGTLTQLGRAIMKLVKPIVKGATELLPTLVADIGYIAGGDPIGLMKSKVDSENGIVKALGFFVKVQGIVPSIMSWAGQKVWKVLAPVLGEAFAAVGDLGANIGDDINSFVAGDIVGMWKNGINLEANGFMGVISGILGYASKILFTVPTGISWVVHNIKDIFGGIASGVKSVFSGIGNAISSVGKFVKNGEVGEMWSSDLGEEEDSEGNPISGIAKPLAIGAKLVGTIPAAVMFVGKKIGSFFSGMVKGTKSVISGIGDSVSSVFKHVKNGSPGDMWTEDLPDSEDSPLGFMAKPISIGAKLVGTIPAAVMFVGKKIGSFFSGITNGVKNTFSMMKAQYAYGEALMHQPGSKLSDNIKEMMTVEDPDPENPIGGFTKGLIVASRLVSVPVAMVKAVGYKIADTFKSVISAVKNTITTAGGMAAQSLSYIPSGDLVGLWKSDYEDDEGNPVSGFFKGVHVASKVAATPFTAISWVGHKVWEGIKKIPGIVVNGYKTSSAMAAQSLSYIPSGDLVGLWKSDYEDDEGNPVSGFFKGVHVASKVAATPFTAISWVGHKVWEGIKNVASVITSSAKTLWDMNSQLNDYALSGDVVGMWKSDYEDDEGNPVGGFTKGIYVANKVLHTPFAAISWVSHKAWKGIKKISSAVTNSVKTLGSMAGQLSGYITSGDVVGMWKSDYEDDEGNPVGGFVNGVYVGGKVLATIPTVVSLAGHTIWDNIKKIASKVSQSFKTLGSMVSQLSGYAASGDITGLWNSEYMDDEGNPVSGFTKGVYTGGKVVMTIPTAVSLAGHTIWDNIKKIASKVSQSFGNLASMVGQSFSYVPSGDLSGLWSSEYMDDDGNPVSGFNKGVFIASKVIATVPTAVSLAGHKVWEGIQNVASKIANSFQTLTGMVGQSFSYVPSGDLSGLWESDYEDDDGNPVSGFNKGVFIASKVVSTIPTAVSWVGHTVWEKITGTVKAIKADFKTLGANISSHWGYVKKGDPAGLWQSEYVESPDNPMGGFLKFLANGSKLIQTVPAGISWVIHKATDGFKTLVGNIKSNYKSMGDAMGKVNKLAAEGHGLDLWDVDLTCKQFDPLTPLWHFFLGVVKVVQTIRGGIISLADSLPLIGDWAKDKINGFIDGTKDVTNSIGEATKEEVSEHEGTTTDANVQAAKEAANGTVSNLIGGTETIVTTGNGPGNKKLSGGMGDGPTINENIPDEMNGVKYFSQNDPRWATKKYESSNVGNSDGATMADTGCGPTAMAMITSEMDTDNPTTPVSIANDASAAGFRDETGTNKEFVQNIAGSHGLSVSEYENPDATVIKNSLSSNNPILLLGQSDGSSDSPYTTSGHYLVATGVDSSDNLIINDPRGVKYSHPININTAARQTRSLWSFAKNVSKKDFDGAKHNKEHGEIIRVLPSKKSLDMLFGGRGGLSAQNIIDIALAEVGYTEHASTGDLNSPTDNVGTNSYNKYSKDLYGNPQMDWCAAFVTWCFYQALGKDKEAVSNMFHGIVFGNTASCNKIKGAFKKDSAYFSGNPEPGDLILFNWESSGDREVDHIGIVVGFDGQYVTVCEGNSSDKNGYDAVRTKRYQINDSEIDGFGRPSYGASISWDSVKNSSIGSNVPIATNTTKKDNNSGGVIGKFTSMLSKLGSTLFDAVITGNWDIDWDNVFSDQSQVSATVADGTSSDMDGIFDEPETVEAAELKDINGDKESAAKTYFQFLLRKGKGFTHEAASAILGNLYDISKLTANDLDAEGEKGLDTNDVKFTSLIDESLKDASKIKTARSLFVDTNYGYGIANFKSKDLKGKLFDSVIGANSSISNPLLQLQVFSDYLINKFGDNTDALYANDLKASTDAVLEAYQKPDDSEAYDRRYSYAKYFYDKFKDVEVKINSTHDDEILSVNYNTNNPGATVTTQPKYIPLTDSDKIILKNINDLGLSKVENAKSDWDSKLQDYNQHHLIVPTINSASDAAMLENGTYRRKADEFLMGERVKKLEEFYENKGYKLPDGVKAVLEKDGDPLNLIAAINGAGEGDMNDALTEQERVQKSLEEFYGEKAKEDPLKDVIEHNATHAYVHPLTQDLLGKIFHISPYERTTVDLIRLASQHGDMDAMYQLGERGHGQFTGYDWNGNEKIGTLNEPDKLAMAYIKAAALDGQMDAVHGIISNIGNYRNSEGDPSFYMNDGYLNDEEYNRLLYHYDQETKADWKNFAVKSAMAGLGFAGLMFPPAAKVVGEVEKQIISKSLMGSGIAANYVPLVGGASSKILKGAGKLAGKIPASAYGTATSLGLIGAAYFGPEIFNYGTDVYDKFDYEKYFDEGGTYEADPRSGSLMSEYLDTNQASNGSKYFDSISKTAAEIQDEVQSGTHKSSSGTKHGGDGGGFGEGIRGGRGSTTTSMVDGKAYFSQNDPRWANKKFIRSDGHDDGATIGDSGCGPMAMAMAMSDITDKRTDPMKVAKSAQESGFRDDTGTNWAFIDSAAYNSGARSHRLPDPDGNEIQEALRSGNSMVLSGASLDNKESSPYTTAGHYVVATGLDGNGNIKISDPRGVRYNKTISPDRLAYDTQMAWSFTRDNTANSLHGAFGISPRKKRKRKRIRGGRGSASNCPYTGSFTVTQEYKGSAHDGMDMVGNTSKDIHATCDGVVEHAGWQRDSDHSVGFGQYISIKDSSSDHLFIYGHLSQICVKVGDKVTKGQKIGVEGNTGESTGSHCHYCIRKGGITGESINIADFMGIPNEQGTYDSDMVSTSASISTTTGTSSSSGYQSGAEKAMNKFSSLLGKFGTTMGQAVMNNNFDIDWESELSEDTSSTISTSGNAVSSVSLSGSDNRSKIYNYLTSTAGMTKNAAAGVMGCWQAESSNSPDTLEGYYAFDDSVVKNAPKNNSTLDDYTENYLFPMYSRDGVSISRSGYKGNDGHYYPGFGLAQWTGPRGANLLEYSNNHNMYWGDLGAQLSFFMNGPGEFMSRDGLLERLNATGSPEDAATLFLGEFELPNYSSDHNSKRRGYAREIYNELAGGGKGTGGGRGEGTGGQDTTPTVRTKKYDTSVNQKVDRVETLPKQTPVRTTPNPAMTAEQKSITQNNNINVNTENLEKLLKDISSLLNVISNNTDSLSTLNDIKSKMSSMGNNTNTIVTNNNISNGSKSPRTQQKKKTSQSSGQMSRDEKTAREIAFGR